MDDPKTITIIPLHINLYSFINKYMLEDRTLTTTKHDTFVLKVNAEAYSKPSQTSKVEHFAKIVNFAKHSILDIWLCSRYDTEICVVSKWLDHDETLPSRIFKNTMNKN